MIRRARTSARRQDGFTVIEMLVSMIFIGMLFGAFALVLSSTLHHNDEIQEESTLQAEVRGALDRFEQDLRQAYTGDEAVSPIESIGATQLTFLSPDRATPFHNRRISYRISSGNLERAMATSTDTDGPPWDIPVLGAWGRQVGSIVNGTVFTYLDAGGVATADPALVRTVVVTLTVATKISPTRQVTYKTSVTLRTPV